MEKITKEIYIDRYEVKTSSLETFEFEDILKYSLEIDIYFNTNNTGLKFASNFLNGEEVSLKKYEDIKQYLTDEKQVFTVVSFYAENSYEGIYTNDKEDCLQRRCNNWVDFGKDGFVFLFVAKDKETLAKSISHLNQYINYGMYYIEVYDNLNEDFTDSVLRIDENEEYLDAMLKKYDLSL